MEWTVPAVFLYRGNIISKESLGYSAAARQMKLPETLTDNAQNFLTSKHIRVQNFPYFLGVFAFSHKAQ
jgi:hypothetical protein